MGYNDLLRFMKKEYGEGGDAVLKRILESYEIEDLDQVDTSRKRNVAKDIRDLLPTVSMSRRNLLYAEILKILNIELLDTGKDSMKAEVIASAEETEQTKITHFTNDVDRSLTKFETIFNLFWLKAGEAELRGMGHNDVMQITHKALAGIKNDLDKYRQGIIESYNLLEKRKLQFAGFHLKEVTSFDKKIKERNDVEFENKTVLKNVIESFWRDIDNTYIKFQELFIKTMERDIEIKKEGKDDSELIAETQKKMLELWQDLEKAYGKFKTDIKEARRTIEANYDRVRPSG